LVINKNIVENFFDTLSGGNFALLIKDNIEKFVYAENSVFLIDDWNDEVINGEYFVML